MEENGGWPKLGYYLGVFLEWLRKTTKILSLNRGSGCRCEPRTTQILKHACCHSTWHLWYASAYITRGSPICSSPRRYFQRCCPSGEYPRLLQKGSCPYLYPRRYNQAAIMSWSATLFQQCMWALPGSCHHVTNTGRNIRRWLWRLCSWGLGGGGHSMQHDPTRRTVLTSLLYLDLSCLMKHWDKAVGTYDRQFSGFHPISGPFRHTTSFSTPNGDFSVWARHILCLWVRCALRDRLIATVPVARCSVMSWAKGHASVYTQIYRYQSYITSIGVLAFGSHDMC